jgi:hypothetical protein
VEIRHAPSAVRPSLQLAWAATRPYFELEDQAGVAVPAAIRHSQRAVSFFRLDLENGDCELRIQSFPHEGQGLPSRQEEVERYRAEAARFVDLGRFEPVLIEPVARRWLREPPLEVRRWTVVRPNGGSLEGHEKGETLLQRLIVVLGEFFARSLTMRWACKQRATPYPLFFSLDGQGDIVDFNGIADASRVDFILDGIRKAPPPGLVMKELRQLAARYPEHARILAALDHQFMVRTRLRVSLKELSTELWYPAEQIRAVMEVVEREAPGTFSLVGEERDTLEMSNRLRLREGGLVDKLQRRADGKGDRRAKELVKPALSFVLVLALIFYDTLVSWLLSTFWQALTGTPSVVVELGLDVLLGLAHAALTYGSKRVRDVIVRVIRSALRFVRWLSQLRPGNGEASIPPFETMYAKWSLIAGQAGVTWPPERAPALVSPVAP